MLFNESSFTADVSVVRPDATETEWIGWLERLSKGNFSKKDRLYIFKADSGNFVLSHSGFETLMECENLFFVGEIKKHTDTFFMTFEKPLLSLVAAVNELWHTDVLQFLNY